MKTLMDWSTERINCRGLHVSLKGPVHTDPGKFENASFFSLVRPTVHTKPAFSVTEKGAFQKRSPKWVSFSNLPGLMWTENILRSVFKFTRVSVDEFNLVDFHLRTRFQLESKLIFWNNVTCMHVTVIFISNLYRFSYFEILLVSTMSTEANSVLSYKLKVKFAIGLLGIKPMQDFCPVLKHKDSRNFNGLSQSSSLFPACSLSFR